MNPAISISIAYAPWRRIAGIARITKQAVAACADVTDNNWRPEAELSILLCADERMRELNMSWRGIDKPTNVLSFPLGNNAEQLLLGDIVIAYETLEREARESEKPFLDHYVHMIAHGFLHLLGFDHETSAEAEVMEAQERTVLARLNIPDPYAMGPKTKARSS